MQIDSIEAELAYVEFVDSRCLAHIDVVLTQTADGVNSPLNVMKREI